VFDAIRQMMAPPLKGKKRNGFRAGKEKTDRSFVQCQWLIPNLHASLNIPPPKKTAPWRDAVIYFSIWIFSPS